MKIKYRPLKNKIYFGVLKTFVNICKYFGGGMFKIGTACAVIRIGMLEILHVQCKVSHLPGSSKLPKLLLEIIAISTHGKKLTETSCSLHLSMCKVVKDNMAHSFVQCIRPHEL